YEALQSCEDLLLQFGGHEAAAGLAIEIEKLEEFKERFNTVLRRNMTDENRVHEIHVDTKITFAEITPKFLRVLDQFAPFGPGNMRPVFMSENVSLVYPPRIVGTNHIVASLRQNGNDKVFDAIGFNLGAFAANIDKGKNLVDIVYTIETIQKDGKSYPQIRLKDMLVKENQSVSADSNVKS
ncbi:MAG: single-stranded-DNA-specific exonuclease RecJ, partial [Melioribacteraceae bacterium]